MAATFFGASSTEDDLDIKDEAVDSIAEASSANVAQHFRGRYADLPRIIRESTSAVEAMDSIVAMLSTSTQVASIEQTLISNALNATA